MASPGLARVVLEGRVFYAGNGFRSFKALVGRLCRTTWQTRPVRQSSRSGANRRVLRVDE